MGTLIAALLLTGAGDDDAVRLFNGKDFTGLTHWLKDTGHKDPDRVFRVTDGMLHFTGEHPGYVATDKVYGNYRLVVEYKWGEKTWGFKHVRNSGILLHATGPHGGAGRNTWMSSIECQLAQGCAGDFILIRGKDKKGDPVPITITSDTEKGPDGRPRWKKGGAPTKYSRRQFWWSKHDPEFKERLDERGRWDVESPVGKWTRVEVTAKGNRISISINGTTVNKCYDVSPAKGKILLQTEGFEIFFRKFELYRLKD